MTGNHLSTLALALIVTSLNPLFLRRFPIMTRFFAHLCLFLQIIDIPTPAVETQVILEVYLGVLEAAGQRELIAMYAGALGDNAILRYAMFLTSLDVSTDINERRLALTRAREHGLDMERVAVTTAERTIEKAFAVSRECQVFTWSSIDRLQALPPFQRTASCNCLSTASRKSIRDLSHSLNRVDFVLVQHVSYAT